MAQIRPNAPKYRRREKAINYQKAATTGNKRFDPELRLMQKAANERMRQLEKQGIKSPAYNALQAKLEILDGMDNGKLIINNDNDMLHNWYISGNEKNVVTIGINNESNYMAKNINIS